MTQNQTLKFVAAQIKEHGLYIVANKIGVQHSTLTRFLHGDRVYGPVTVKIDAYVARGGRVGAASKSVSKPAKKAAKKVAKKPVKAVKTKAPKKVATKKTAKKPVKKALKASKPRIKTVSSPSTSPVAETAAVAAAE